MDSSLYESKEITLDNIKYNATKNYKIKTKTINSNNQDLLRRNFSPIINKKKVKIFEPKAMSPKARPSVRKSILSFCPVNISSNKKITMKEKEKNDNIINSKKLDKRKSFLSQGYNVKLKDNKENSICIRNKSYYCL